VEITLDIPNDNASDPLPFTAELVRAIATAAGITEEALAAGPS